MSVSDVKSSTDFVSAEEDKRTAAKAELKQPKKQKPLTPFNEIKKLFTYFITLSFQKMPSKYVNNYP